MASRSHLVAFFLLLLACGVRMQDDVEVDEEEDDVAEEDDKVIVITAKNFDRVLATHPYLLVEFHLQTCDYCKRLEPEYTEAARYLHEVGSVARLGKVDGAHHRVLSKEFAIPTFPTLIFFKDGDRKKPRSYKGDHNAAGILAWLARRTGPVAYELDTVASAQALLNKSDTVVLGFFKEPEGEQQRIYFEVADNFDVILFGVSSKPEVFLEFGVTEDSVIVFKKDEGHFVFNKQIEKDDLYDFIKMFELPLVLHFSTEVAPKLFAHLVRVHTLLFASNESSSFPELYAEFRGAAASFRGKIIFVFVNTEEPSNGRLLDFFALNEDELPEIRLIHMENKTHKFRPVTNELSAANIQNFCQDYLDGKLKPHHPSAEIPEDWDKDPVKVLVGKNFDDVALAEDKAVFVMIYAPWCTHCKNLAPVWEKLGEEFKDEEGIIIAKMDATRNEVATVQVNQYPSLYYFPAGADKKAVKHEGSMDLEALAEFLRNGGSEVEQVEAKEQVEEGDESPNAEAAPKEEL
uniref:protein disulfide-isomerase-like n=1 Tax=Myxine glutinosa TaxID=7769 RepID=UPI00358E586D